MEELRTCYPAKIVSYNPETQTCTCKVQVEDYYSGLDYSYEKMAAPLLIDVPVLTAQGGGWALTFPIKPDDDCLVLFAQKGYDHWLYSGASETGLVGGAPTSEHYREFALQDAMCIVGLNPIPRAIPNYNPEDCELRNKDKTHRITLKANGDIEVHTDTDFNLTANNVNVEATKVKVKADEVIVECPMTKFLGSISVGGSISMGGGKSSYTCELNGTLKINGQTISTGGASFSGDVVAKGKSLSGHIHKDAEGRPTTPPE